MTSENAGGDAERETRALYSRLIEAWDKRNAREYALQFAADGVLVGFDGSQVNGQLEVGGHVTEVFSHHQTPRYVTIVRDVRPLATDVTLLRANAGLIPAGKEDIDPALNSIQSMIAVRKSDAWKIALFQNTPAAFHMRPELAKQLTDELRAKLRGSRQEK